MLPVFSSGISGKEHTTQVCAPPIFIAGRKEGIFSENLLTWSKRVAFW